METNFGTTQDIRIPNIKEAFVAMEVRQKAKKSMVIDPVNQELTHDLK